MVYICSAWLGSDWLVVWPNFAFGFDYDLVLFCWVGFGLCLVGIGFDLARLRFGFVGCGLELSVFSLGPFGFGFVLGSFLVGYD